MADNLLKFPLDLDNHPSVTFTAKDPTDNNTKVQVSLYAPQSIVISDGMGYGNFNLGLLANAIANVQTKEDGSIDLEAFERAVRKEAEGSTNDASTISALMAKVGSNAFGVGSTFADARLFSTRVALNPNTVLQFTGPEVRSFSFTFQMVSESVEDSRAIRDIINRFRSRMYPERQGTAILKYPDIFDIKFDLADQTAGNEEFIPRYSESYLTGMSVTYNASSNMYHVDGSPVDVSVALNFTENKALTRGEIEKLQKAPPVDVS